MNPQRIRNVFELAEYYGLNIEWLDLPANNAGYLDPHPDPRYIAVNRNLPHCEHVFTVAHELCHHLKDHHLPRRKYPHRFLNRQYQSRRARMVVKYYRHILNRFVSPEFEADMFAMSSLVQLGDRKNLTEFIHRHPEKFWLCMFIMADALVRMPFRISKAFWRKLFSVQTEA